MNDTPIVAHQWRRPPFLISFTSHQCSTCGDPFARGSRGAHPALQPEFLKCIFRYFVAVETLRIIIWVIFSEQSTERHVRKSKVCQSRCNGGNSRLGTSRWSTTVITKKGRSECSDFHSNCWLRYQCERNYYMQALSVFGIYPAIQTAAGIHGGINFACKSVHANSCILCLCMCV